MKLVNLVGRRYGRLIVIRQHPEIIRRRVAWVCICALQSGNSKSCGCKRLEKMSVHSASKTPLYKGWNAMHMRCKGKRDFEYRAYTARGIKVCAEWKNFLPFMGWALANGYSPGLTLDRINNNGNYEPENCRWVTMAEQMGNTRRSLVNRFDVRTITMLREMEEARSGPTAISLATGIPLRVVQSYRHGQNLARKAAAMTAA